MTAAHCTENFRKEGESPRKYPSNILGSHKNKIKMLLYKDFSISKKTSKVKVIENIINNNNNDNDNNDADNNNNNIDKNKKKTKNNQVGFFFKKKKLPLQP